MTNRILYVIGSLELGGAERHLVQVATGLKKRGYAPEFFVLAKGGPLTQQLDDAGIPIHGITPPGWLKKLIPHKRAYAWTVLAGCSLALLRVLWWRRPSVVHFFLPAAYVIGGILSLLSPVGVRIMSRRSLNHYQSKHRLFARVERFLHPRMTLVCGNSLAVNRQLGEEGVDPQRLKLIYNGVALRPLPAERPARDPVAGLVYIAVANLIPYKGHADLLDAFGSIREQLPQNWELWCVGRDDGIGQGLKERAERLGIASHVRFLGSRSDVPDLLLRADVGVLCSHEEGFSNAVLEAMAAGLPMVVTDVGGNAEAVVDGDTGYVVPPKDPPRLAQALLSVALDARRSDMGARGRKRAEELFSMDACLHQYELLYQEAVPALRVTPATAD